MITIEAPRTALTRLLPGRLVGDVAAFGASEAAAKLTRLALVVMMARTLDAATIGLAATALAATEVLKALTQNGVGQRIIAAGATELDSVCRAARRIYWAWCGGLALLQALVAGAFWLGGADPVVALMIAALGAEYLFMPAGLVQCFLAQREGRLKSVAAIAGAQIACANLASAALLLVWPSPFALVLPKALSAPLWLIAMRRLRPWRAGAGPRAPLSHFTGFGAAVLGVELLGALRLHADKFVIGGILGAEALGVWFFAIGAGLGLATSLSTAFAQVVFPHFCGAANPRRALRQGMGLAIGVLAPIIALQALAAPIYVPLIFGAQWAGMADLVSLLCLAAIPAVIWTAAAQWLRATGRARQEAWRVALVAALTLAALAIAAPQGLGAAAAAYVAAVIAGQLLMTWGAVGRDLIGRKD